MKKSTTFCLGDLFTDTFRSNKYSIGILFLNEMWGYHIKLNCIENLFLVMLYDFCGKAYLFWFIFS